MGFDKFRRKVVGVETGDFRATVNVYKGTLVAPTGAGTPLSVANPIGADALIIKAMYNNTGAVTSTPVTLDIGCAAASAIASDDNLIDGINVGTPIAKKVFDNITDKGTNGKTSIIWEKNKYLNVTCSATPTGLAGTLTVHYVRA